MVISRVTNIAHSSCFYAILGEILAVMGGDFLHNKQKNTWILGNMKFISCVEQDISFVR